MPKPVLTFVFFATQWTASAHTWHMSAPSQALLLSLALAHMVDATRCWCLKNMKNIMFFLHLQGKNWPFRHSETPILLLESWPCRIKLMRLKLMILKRSHKYHELQKNLRMRKGAVSAGYLVFPQWRCRAKILEDQSLPSSLSSSLKMHLKTISSYRYKESMQNVVWSQEAPVHMLCKNKALMPAGASG